MLSSELNAEAEAAAETKAPELVDSTNVHLDEPVGELHAWRGYRKAHFVVTAKSGEIAEELPSSGFQRVTANKDGGLNVKVDIAEGSDATEDEINDAEYVEASAMVDGADPAVMEIAAKASVNSQPHPLDFFFPSSSFFLLFLLLFFLSFFLLFPFPHLS